MKKLSMIGIVGGAALLAAVPRRISFPRSFLLRRISFLPRTISLLDLRLA